MRRAHWAAWLLYLKASVIRHGCHQWVILGRQNSLHSNMTYASDANAESVIFRQKAAEHRRSVATFDSPYEVKLETTGQSIANPLTTHIETLVFRSAEDLCMRGAEVRAQSNNFGDAVGCTTTQRQSREKEHHEFGPELTRYIH
ncbi:hypothetical protein J3A83DRAFT_4185186 [Scleroderma citrinum]